MGSARWLVRALVLLAMVVAAFGVTEWLNPSSPPFKGRLSWVAEAVVAIVGPSALAFLWFGLGIALLLVARFVWRHTPKLPSDRWL